MQHSTPPTPKVEQSGNVRILTFTTGRVREFENTIASELEGRTGGMAGGHLMLDFTNVTRITSEDLGTLISLHKRIRSAGGRLTLFNLNPEIYEVFQVTRLESLLGICREDQIPLLPLDAGANGQESNRVEAIGSSQVK